MTEFVPEKPNCTGSAGFEHEGQWVYGDTFSIPKHGPKRDFWDIPKKQRPAKWWGDVPGDNCYCIVQDHLIFRNDGYESDWNLVTNPDEMAEILAVRNHDVEIYESWGAHRNEKAGDSKVLKIIFSWVQSQEGDGSIPDPFHKETPDGLTIDFWEAGGNASHIFCLGVDEFERPWSYSYVPGEDDDECLRMVAGKTAYLGRGATADFRGIKSEWTPQ